MMKRALTETEGNIVSPDVIVEMIRLIFALMATCLIVSTCTPRAVNARSLKGVVRSPKINMSVTPSSLRLPASGGPVTIACGPADDDRDYQTRLCKKNGTDDEYIANGRDVLKFNKWSSNQMQDGDHAVVNVTNDNFTFADAGTYVCTYKNYPREFRKIEVDLLELTVTPSSPVANNTRMDATCQWIHHVDDPLLRTLRFESRSRGEEDVMLSNECTTSPEFRESPYEGKIGKKCNNISKTPTNQPLEHVQFTVTRNMTICCSINDLRKVCHDIVVYEKRGKDATTERLNQTVLNSTRSTVESGKQVSNPLDPGQIVGVVVGVVCVAVLFGLLAVCLYRRNKPRSPTSARHKDHQEEQSHRQNASEEIELMDNQNSSDGNT
ncbi:uncharacterized protein LOC141914284 [Tubulanus polymorphus]|uniref:uncharacterized protein LOC141914284 n=1 Tax=Tubulanus polymorphus TaxID=672921 RepID=UPI003DA349A8